MKINVISCRAKRFPDFLEWLARIKNEYRNIESFYKILKENKLIEIKGSDSHDASLQFYKNMNFFMIDSKEFEKIVH